MEAVCVSRPAPLRGLPSIPWVWSPAPLGWARVAPGRTAGNRADLRCEEIDWLRARDITVEERKIHMQTAAVCVVLQLWVSKLRVSKPVVSGVLHLHPRAHMQ